jgi:seryl-tRNA synthetase
MSNISSIPEVQTVSKPKVSLDDRIAEVQRAINNLDSAIDYLVWALERLDDEDTPASVRELAVDMSHAAEDVRHEFERNDFSDQADELETLADTEEDEEDVS